MPPKKRGMTRDTNWISSCSGVKIRASTPGIRATMTKAEQVTVMVTGQQPLEGLPDPPVVLGPVVVAHNGWTPWVMPWVGMTIICMMDWMMVMEPTYRSPP